MKIKSFLCILKLLFCFQLCAQSENKTTTATTLMLVRHAEQVKSGGNDPVLSPEGIKRADALVALLQHQPLAAIYATSLLRALQTARPLASLNNIAITNYKMEDDASFLIRSILENYAGKTILLIGHSGNIPDFLNASTKSQAYKNLSVEEFNDLYILTFFKEVPAKTIHLKY